MSPPTFYHHGRSLSIAQGMACREGMARILAWATSVPGASGLWAAAPPEDGGVCDTAASASVIVDIRKTMRRDMKLGNPESVNGKTLVLLGLAIPTEVTRVLPADDGAHAVEFCARTACALEMSLKFTMPAQLDEVHVDVMYALAPALAAFFLSHSLAAEGDLDTLAARQRTGARPLVPQAMLGAATSVPYKDHTAGGHISECVAAAHIALKQTGYRVPSLDGVSLTDVTMGDWVATHVGALERMVRLDEEVQGHLEGIRRCMAQLGKLMLIPVPLP